MPEDNRPHPDKNRTERRDHIRHLGSLVRPGASLRVWLNPLTNEETEYARRERARRRARDKRDRAARKRNR